MSDIKVIDELELWEVIKRVQCEEQWAWHNGKVWVVGDGGLRSLARKVALGGALAVAIIDTTTPEIDWDKIDWAFFGEYGGLRINGNRLAFDSADFQWITAELRESPFYYWPGGEQPVPGNIEVEITYIKVITAIPAYMERTVFMRNAGSINWERKDIIAFKLTGRVL